MLEILNRLYDPGRSQDDEVRNASSVPAVAKAMADRQDDGIVILNVYFSRLQFWHGCLIIILLALFSLQKLPGEYIAGILN